MVDTFLFDLDGTLLPMDMEPFVKIYFRELGHAFMDIIDPKVLSGHIWTATGFMIENCGEKTNEQVFLEKFSQLVKEDIELYIKRFNDFYDNGFLRTRDCTLATPEVRESIDILKHKGYELVIATNPIFPRKAVLHRIKWAGLDPEDFIYISSYEHNHFCKPNIRFYEEVLSDTGKTPQRCMMVGNDVQEDLAASLLGIETFLITNHMINRTGESAKCDHMGTYRDFLRFVEELQPVTG